MNEVTVGRTFDAATASAAAGAPAGTTGPAPELQNFRDLATAHPSLKSGALFRGACPVQASKELVAQLRSTLDIHTMVDLRSEEEIYEFGQPPILDGAKKIAHTRAPRPFLIGFLWPSRQMETHAEQLPGEALVGQRATVHHIALLDRGRYILSLIPRIPITSTIAALVTQIWDAQRSSDIFIEEINKGGLAMLYEILLLASMPEFGIAMRVALRAVEGGHPLFFYCKAGKDRTGLLAMLILSICEVPDEAIIEDYFISDAHGKVALGDLASKRQVQKLDREVFAKAPKVAMQQALSVTRARFGDIPTYLEHCGFSCLEQRRLKELLLR